MQKHRDIWENKIKNEWIIWKQNCPFCTKTNKEEEKLILWQSDLWEVRYNKFPYWWIKKHLLAFPKRHVEHITKLTKKEFSWLKDVEKFILNYYKDTQYFVFLRETFYWRSIAHIHYHYLPWNIHGSDFAKILKKQWFTK